MSSLIKYTNQYFAQEGFGQIDEIIVSKGHQLPVC